jgi:NADH-quinone oxidoreductase subunit E/NADP-reducing hydrogenase subunit HndA
MAKLQPEAVEKINQICDRYIGEKTPLMMILSAIQHDYGYNPAGGAGTGIGENGYLRGGDLRRRHVLFLLFPKAQGEIRDRLLSGDGVLCQGLQKVIDEFSALLGVKPGETTPDGMFTLDALRCIGACGIAPR